MSFDKTFYGSDLLNAPMGLAITVDGILFIADTGNDLVRRINVREDNSKLSTVVVSPVDSDSSGYFYDNGEIDDIYRTLGATIRGKLYIWYIESGRVTQNNLNLPRSRYVASRRSSRSREFKRKVPRFTSVICCAANDR